MDESMIYDIKRFFKQELEDRIDGLEVIDSMVSELPDLRMVYIIEGIVASYGGEERVVYFDEDERSGMMSDLADVVRGKLGIKG